MNLVVVTKIPFVDKDKGCLDRDRFMGCLMQSNTDYVNLLKVCRINFVFSHSQANA